MNIKEQLMVRRELWSQLSGMELAVYLSVQNLCGPYDRTVLIYTSSILYNLTGEEKDLDSPIKRKKVAEAIESLIGREIIIGRSGNQGSYYIDGLKSFFIHSKDTDHGFIMINFNNIRKIVQGSSDGREWQGVLRYYLMLLAHMNKDGECRYSLQYFSEKINISELTLSKYNGILKKLGLIKIIRHLKSTSSYLTL